MFSLFRRDKSKSDEPAPQNAVETADPHAAIKNMIREIDAAVSDLSEGYAKAAGRRNEAMRRSDLLTDHLAKLQDKAKIAVSQQREDLAKAIISQQIACEQELAEWQSVLSESQEQIDRLQLDISALKLRKSGLEDEIANALKVEQEIALRAERDLESSVLQERAAQAMAIYDEAVAGLQSEPGDGFDDPTDRTLATESKIESEIDARMAALQQEISSANPTT